MNPIRSIMGRRQFLIAAGVTSTSALAYNKLAGMVDPLLKTGSTTAAEMPASDAKTEEKTYPYILSPLKIRNTVVKNRLLYPLAQPHFLQGPETFPADVLRVFYANIARTAAIVTPRLMTGGSRKERILDSAHMIIYDDEDPAVQNYIDQMIEGIHSMGSLAVSPEFLMTGDLVTQAKKIQDKGYDVVYMDGGDTRSRDSISPYIEQIQKVKNATNLIIMRSIMTNGPEADVEGIVATAKMFEGAVDILRFGSGSAITFNQYYEKGSISTIRLSQAIKESGAKILAMPSGGFGDPDIMEEYLSSGKCDMFSIGRQLHADPDYGKKITEGRGDDIVPCLYDNRCHGNTLKGPWLTVCSVNPGWGLESAFKAVDVPTISKQVAVIGGGPAGMKAAVIASERGHKVTLYEKDSQLGGLLQHADYTPFKWTLKAYKEYLIRQVKKNGVEVHLNTEATPEMIKVKGYDAVIASTGAEPVAPRIPGSDGKNVFDILTVHSKAKSLGKNVVFVGAGEHVVETVIFLIKAGHNVTVLTADKELLSVNRVHYPDDLMNIMDTIDNFSFRLDVTTTRILEGKVFYKDAKGNEKFVLADSVVIHGGLKPRTDEALKFADSIKNGFFMIGDCTGRCGDIQKSTRSAYFAAYQV